MKNGKKREENNFCFDKWQMASEEVFDDCFGFDKWQMANGKKREKKKVFDLDAGGDTWQMANGKK